MVNYHSHSDSPLSPQELSVLSTSAESNRGLQLLRLEETKYLDAYRKESFNDMLNNEFKC